MTDIFSKRIPTVGALFALMVAIAITTFLIQKNTNLIGKASPNINPQDIKVTNVTDASFTVSFTTNEKAYSALSVEGEGVQTSLIFDARDRSSGTQEEYFSHYMTVSGLNASSEYNFSIILGGETILNGDQKFAVKTGPQIETPQASNYITGLIVHPDGEVASDTIVYLQSQGRETVSTLTDNDGAYSFSLNNIRDTSLESIISFESGEAINLEARFQNLFSKTSLKYSKTLSFIPTIILNDSYNFASPEEKTASVTSQLTNSEIKTTNQDTSLKVTSPKEGQSLTDNKPTIQGVAAPNTIVKITINSENIVQGQVKSDNNGFWSFRPKTALPPGNHTVTVETVGPSGITKIIKQNFTVFADGSQVQESATPSATPKLTSPTPTFTPTPIPTKASSSPTPSTIVSPSVQTSLTPTTTTSFQPTSGNQASPTLGLQSPGTPEQALLLTFVSFAFILAGSALLFILI